MVDVVDAFQLRIALLDDLIEAHAAHARKGRVEARQRLHVCIRAHMLVMVEDDGAHLVFHRNDRFGKATFFPGGCGALLGFDGKGIDIIAGEAPLGRNRVCANALRREVGFDRDGRVRRPCAAARAHWHARHGFHAAADCHVGFAGHDLGGGHVAGFKAGRAETVDLYASCRLGIFGVQHGDPCNVAALLTNG